jgi:GT2 family glycosyltransferase
LLNGVGGKEGPCDFFGGGVLIRREALEDANGYDEYLIAGEDPDLSYRIREKGWEINVWDMTWPP